MIYGDTVGDMGDSKHQRSSRLYKFKTVTLQLLGLDYDVYFGEPGKWMFYLYTSKYGKVTIYPKGDRIHLSGPNKWINGVDDWLYKNLIKEK